VPPPNVIFIFSDQHNPLVMSHAGDPTVRTPNLDALAREGTSLTNCYCPSPLCVPSRMAMLAGLLPTETGVYNNHQCLSSDRATFLHCLAAAGYETVLCGRMHFVGPDQRHGYTRRLVGDITPTTVAARGEKSYGYLQGTPGSSRIALERAGPGNSNVLAYDREVTDAACELIKGWTPDRPFDFTQNVYENRSHSGAGGTPAPRSHTRSQDKPLFLTVGLYGPHCPYVCPKELFDYYHERLPPPSLPEGFRENVHPAIRAMYEHCRITDVPDGWVLRARAAYYGLVELTDGYVGRIMRAVEERFDRANTLVIYSSDHGDTIGHNGLFWKRSFYEGSARVPMIFSLPGSIGAGECMSANTSLLDLGPTLIELAGAPQLPRTHGMSLWPALLGREEAPADRAIISQLGVATPCCSAMIRKARWKLVSCHGYDQPQLFDLSEDPLEQNDLGADPSLAQLRRELLAELSVYWDADAVHAARLDWWEHQKLLRLQDKAAPAPQVEHWTGRAEDNYILDHPARGTGEGE